MSFEPTDLGGPYATVFDVGAFRGDFAKACLKQWEGCRVLSFEPLEPMPIESVEIRTWSWYGFALGGIRDRRTINRCEFVPSSSFLPMTNEHKTAFPYTRDHTLADVDVYPLDDLRSLIEQPALLKIDVQGYELEVLRGAWDSLAMFDAVVCEVSHVELYEGAPRHEQLDSFLSIFGFTHQRVVDTLRDPDDRTRILQTDELWAR